MTWRASCEDEMIFSSVRRCVLLSSMEVITCRNLSMGLDGFIILLSKNFFGLTLDMREVIRGFTNKDGQALELSTRLWYTRLASSRPGHPKAPLRSCSNSTLNNSAHRYNARAFLSPSGSSVTAWDRIRELTATISERASQTSTRDISGKIEKVIGRH